MYKYGHKQQYENREHLGEHTWACKGSNHLIPPIVWHAAIHAMRSRELRRAIVTFRRKFASMWITHTIAPLAGAALLARERATLDKLAFGVAKQLLALRPSHKLAQNAAAPPVESTAAGLFEARALHRETGHFSSTRATRRLRTHDRTRLQPSTTAALHA